jgi:hypothetical protein
MKKIILCLPLIWLILESHQGIQEFTPDGKDSVARKVDYSHIVPLFACDTAQKGVIYATREQALALMRNKLCIIDQKKNAKLPMLGYEMNYCEKGLYEDSTGTPAIITECSFMPFIGDSIPVNWIRSMEERLYKGDSLHFSSFVTKVDEKIIKTKKTLDLVIR